jgi:hypothetical protein
VKRNVIVSSSNALPVNLSGDYMQPVESNYTSDADFSREGSRGAKSKSKMRTRLS